MRLGTYFVVGEKVGIFVRGHEGGYLKESRGHKTQPPRKEGVVGLGRRPATAGQSREKKYFYLKLSGDSDVVDTGRLLSVSSDSYTASSIDIDFVICIV